MKRALANRIQSMVRVIACSVITCGCAGTVLVGYEFSATASAEREAGSGSRSIVSTVDQASSIVGRTSNLKAMAATSKWEIGLVTNRLYAVVTNVAAERIVLRLDKALIASNFEARPSTLQLNDLRLYVDSTSSRDVGRVYGGDTPFVTLRPVSIAPGGKATITMEPAYELLFPSASVFNVRRSVGSTVFVDKGIGNTLSFWIPVESSSGTETLRFELKAVDVAAKLITF
jgi:hypothetical protein